VSDTFEERFQHNFEAKLVHPSGLSKNLPTPAASGYSGQTTKAVFGAHRPHPPQTPAPSF
jgi:hypothetical protein